MAIFQRTTTTSFWWTPLFLCYYAHGVHFNKEGEKEQEKKQRKQKDPKKKKKQKFPMTSWASSLMVFILIFFIYFTQQTLESKPSLMFNSSKSFTPKQTQNHKSLYFFNSKNKSRNAPWAPQIKTQPTMLHYIENKITPKHLLQKIMCK
jgi:cytoskeletal protein RodZ